MPGTLEGVLTGGSRKEDRAGATHDEAEELVSEAIVLHVEGLVGSGLSVPGHGETNVGQVDPPLPA